MMRKCLVLVGLLVACAHQPSEVSRNRHGYRLAVIESVEAYRRTVTADPTKRLVDLEREIPGIRLDIRYATENNFMKRALYPVSRAFLRAPAAAALRNVQEELRQEGLAVKVFDAYRPYRVTVAMWEPIKNPDYVADPAKGSRHNRGCAVDLTLISLSGGEELPMPTPYDDFTSRAAQAFEDLPANVLKNRALLRDVMERHGFAALPSEWWHFDFVGWQSFDLLDIPLEELAGYGSVGVDEAVEARSSNRCPSRGCNAIHCRGDGDASGRVADTTVRREMVSGPGDRAPRSDL